MDDFANFEFYLIIIDGTRGVKTASDVIHDDKIKTSYW